MKRIALLFITSFIYLSSCTEKEEIPLLKIQLNPMLAEEVDLRQISDSIYAVALETNDTCLITNIRDISLYNHKIYIYDMEACKVFIFNDQGKILSVINDKGDGPNNYLSISCFYIDKHQNMLILVDNKKKKEYCYNLTGNYLYNRPINYSIKSVAFFCNKRLVVREQVDAIYNAGFLINIYEQDSLINQYLPFHYENGTSISSKDHPETILQSGFYYNSLNNDTIYKYDKYGFKPCFLIDFGTQGIPIEIKSMSLDKRSSAIYQYLKGHDYKVASWFSVLSQKNNTMLVSYGYNKTPHLGIYDLKKEVVVKEYCNPLLGSIAMSDIITSYFYCDNSFCFVIDSYRISSYDKHKLKETQHINREFWNKIKNINIENNPVLLICKSNLLDNKNSLL